MSEENTIVTITHVRLRVDLVNKMLGYLETRPIGEAVQLFLELKTEAEIAFEAEKNGLTIGKSG